MTKKLLVPLLMLTTYVVGTKLLLRLMALDPPAPVQVLISVMAVPLFYMFRPLYGLLRPLGMLEGEYWRLPSSLGFAVGIGIYAAVIALGMILFRRS